MLQAMPDDLSQRAHEQLTRLGVEVRLGSRVTAIDGGGLEVQQVDARDGASDSYRIECRCSLQDCPRNGAECT